MVKIGIIGFGVVGSGVYEVIRKNKVSINENSGKEIDIKYVLDIRDFSEHPESGLFIKDFDTMLNDDEISVVVETMGGLEPAYEYTKKALASGKSVVTSNKELVATHGDELLKIAYDNNCRYLFEASVGGGIPIIRPMRECLASNEIRAIRGILNGTTNYILTQMIKEGQSFGDALKDAQHLGYAERIPTADVEGHDACRKIAILASIATGKKIEYKMVHTEGISNISLKNVSYAENLGYVVKLIGMCDVLDNGTVSVMVAPMMLPNVNPLSCVEGVNNAIAVEGNAVGNVMFYGPGAGKLPTASAVIADVIESAKNSGRDNRLLWKKCDDNVIAPKEDAEFKFFVRMSCDIKDGKDKIGSIFGERISIEIFDGEFGFVTDKMSEKELKKKLSETKCEAIDFIRILD